MRKVLAIGICILFGVKSDFASAQQQSEVKKPEGLTEDLNNRTVRFDSTETGLGVLYFGPDGRVFLWFPGQMKIASGIWSDQSSYLKTNPSNIDAADKVITFRQICLEFHGVPRASFVTRKFGPKECFTIHEIKKITREIVDGDLLNLTSEKVPCRICPDDQSLSLLMEKIAD